MADEIRETHIIAEAITHKDSPTMRESHSFAEAVTKKTVDMLESHIIVEVLVRSSRPTAEMYILD